ncbi:MAG: sensor histidine kinase [Thermoanaerobaculia bacterium]
MHPILARPGRLAAYLVASLPLAAVLTALLAGTGTFGLADAAALAVPMTLLYAFLSLSVWYPCRAFPLARSSWPLALVTHGAAALLTSAVWVFLGAGVASLLGDLAAFAGLAERYAAWVPALFSAGVLFYLVSAALHYVLISFETARERERKEAELEILAREAELQALKARIQPHFLFNSLNAVSSLIGRDPARAREMCLGLAEFLRASLAAGERPSIRFSEELSLARHYLDVERIRFGSRLEVEEEIESGGSECLVPPLLLQPLVENAVVHGISTLIEGGTIRLEARRAGHRLRIVVENPFDPEAPARRSGGLGLRIVRERLAALYGSDAIFAAKRLDGRHLAIISVPARLEAAP